VDYAKKIVTQLPLAGLWTKQGPVPAERVGVLDESDIIILLHSGKVEFVVADVGKQLEWIYGVDGDSFFKSEVQGHVVDPAKHAFQLDDYAGGYCYRASEWRQEGTPPVVLLERFH
jgi:hypothetical protein